jgi:hypothetical protein
MYQILKLKSALLTAILRDRPIALTLAYLLLVYFASDLRKTQ